MSTKKRKLKPGDPVVYRLGRFGMVKFGWLSHRNQYDDWEPGCWVVRDAADQRTYAVENRKGGTLRAATKADERRFAEDHRAKKARTAVESLAESRERYRNLGAGTTAASSSATQKKKPKGAQPADLGESAGKAVEQALADKKRAKKGG